MMPEQRNLGDLFKDEVQQVQGPQRQLVSVVDLSQPDPKWGPPIVPTPEELNFIQRFWRKIW